MVAQCYVSMLDRFYQTPVVVAEFLIPKGSRYFIGIDDEIVSDQIKFVKYIA